MLSIIYTELGKSIDVLMAPFMIFNKCPVISACEQMFSEELVNSILNNITPV